MRSSRRGVVALVAGLITTLVVPTTALAATTATTAKKPTTTTSRPATTTTTIDPATVPPPPAFGLPLDYGLKLIQQREEASHDLAASKAALPGDHLKASVAERRWRGIQRHLASLAARTRRTQHDLDIARDNLRAAAVEAYMNAGSSRLAVAITAMANASSALDAGRTIHLIGSFGDQQDELVKEYVALKKRLATQRRQVLEQKRAADVMLVEARRKVEADDVAIAHAHVRLTATVLGIMEFEKAATSASSPILGPSVLTAQQLADFLLAQGYRPRITVPLDVLAQLYITEGDNTGVRGDVAFAQSILETGGFTFPGGGQVLVHDNNFAGIGACDTCPHGFSFDTAETGVRAQMQALRIYVDANLTETTLKQPLVMPKMLGLGFRGRVQTWWDLWGTWATGAFYGQRVYDIYVHMVEFAKTDPAHEPGKGPAIPPAPPPVP